MNRTAPRLVQASTRTAPAAPPPTAPLPLPARHRQPPCTRGRAAAEIALTVAAVIALVPLALAVCAVPILLALLVVMLVVGLVTGIVSPLAFAVVVTIPLFGAFLAHTLDRPRPPAPVTAPAARASVCPRCGNHRWVCENHPDRPWYELAESEPCCGGAGAPCPDCSRADTSP